MAALDTNVLVRYIMQDDPKQSSKATRLMESLTSDQPGFVPLVRPRGPRRRYGSPPSVLQAVLPTARL